ncbi:MAG: glutathione transferase GstA [Gammaproteobacteria bacterium]|nr:glutathione transferase GstA [Gammaproteobacteria bacterium]
MKLYFSPGACSLAPHITLYEAGLPFTADKVDMRTRRTSDGQDFGAVNPKGYVPALMLDNGDILSECPAILQYVADQKPDAGLAPPAGTLASYRLMEWLSFIATELHKGFAPLLRPGAPEDAKATARDRLGQRFAYVANHMASRQYLVGEHFTVADAYLYTVLTWTRLTGIDLGAWPVLVAYRERIEQRPAVQAARNAEGLKS